MWTPDCKIFTEGRPETAGKRQVGCDLKRGTDRSRASSAIRQDPVYSLMFFRYRRNPGISYKIEHASTLALAAIEIHIP
jgi:hypothetical protein